MRILAVDPGDKRIGIALSDPSGTIASPLAILNHLSRLEDAKKIAELARVNQAGLIVIGQPLDSEGNPGPAARKAIRLGDVLKTQTDLPIEFWDESDSTQEVIAIMSMTRGKKRVKRDFIDDLAAVVILDSYIESSRIPRPGNGQKNDA